MIKSQIELVKQLWNLTDDLIAQDLDVSQIYIHSLDQKLAFATLEKFHKTLPETLKCPNCDETNPASAVEIVYHIEKSSRGTYTHLRCKYDFCGKTTPMGAVLRHNQ
ncbi:hypothetical protein LCGC14_0195680 [marine sediment metagenome]|uniref:Uncharacterized protein n=1 Tax=marine sediment metagenome TaxID=412755 RepID=A0A0F9UKF1_9ZZZZ